MKVSLNLAQRISNVDLKSIPLAELLQKIGSQLGAVEEVIDWRGRYDGIYVAKLVDCQPHPDSDHMHVCLLDDGGAAQGVERNQSGHVQVVCGAPNVAAGQTVAWLAPGCTVPATADDAEPFVLGSRNLRGVMSNGMIGSAKELGIGDDHSGILTLSDSDLANGGDAQQSLRPGTPFGQLFDLDDVVIDCENKMFTHRPDCFGVLGVARELAAINGLSFASPDWYLHPPATTNNDNLQLKAVNDIPQLVRRFMVQSVAGVSVGMSPLWLRSALCRSGLRPVNNLVDWSNYYMQLTAQPTHAFDYDKLRQVAKGDELVVGPRLARDGEKLELLGGKTINLHPEDMVICANDVPVALAGVMGGAATEVDANTTNIVVECATFDMYTVRRSSMRHGLFTDAVTRFNKGQSPWQNPSVLAKLVADIVGQTGGQAGQALDLLTDGTAKPLPIRVSADFINRRLGSDLSLEELHQLLVRAELLVEKTYDDLSVTPPWWRMDLEQPEDIVEEVGRLYGFDKLPVILPKRSTKAAARDLLLDTKAAVRHALAAAGANEVLTYSFVHGDVITKAGQNVAEAYQLRNALSPQLQYYRLTLTPSLVAQLQPNLKAGFEEFALFEMNKTHVKMHGLNDENVPLELNMLSLAYVANDKFAGQRQGAAFYQVRRLLDHLAHTFGMTLRYEALTADPPYQVCKPFDWQRSALIYDCASGEFIGQIGEYTAELKRNFKLPDRSAGFEISTEALAKCRQPLSYRLPAKFPSIDQDITVELSPAVAHYTVQSALVAAAETAATEIGCDVMVTALSSFKPNDVTNRRHSFRLTINHPQRTLKTEEANSLVDSICNQLEAQVGAARI